MKSTRDTTPPVQYHESHYDPGNTSDEVQLPRRMRSDASGHSGRVTILGALGAWKLETIAVALAVGFLAAIFITLSYFNGKDVPNWPVSLNLNSLVAIYATILRALLLFAIAEVLSQEKWYWFKRPRPLRNLDDFDLASRGALGSLKLIAVAFSSVIPLVAAITTIVLLAIGPFTQQSVKTTLCRRILDTRNAALIPVAAKLDTNDVGVMGDAGPITLPPAALNAVRAGLTTPSSGSTFNLPFSCQTGNCTFPEFNGITHTSLGLCSACEDHTSSVIELPGCPTNGSRPTYTNCKYEISPPNAPSTQMMPSNYRFQMVPSYPQRKISSTSDEIVAYDWVNATILTRSRAGCVGEERGGNCLNTPKYPKLPGLQNKDFNYTIVGATCRLYPCIKHYRGEVRGGELVERVVSNTKLTINITSGSFTTTLAGVADPCLVDGRWYDSSNMDELIPKYGEIAVKGHSKPTAPKPCVYKLQNDWMYLMSKELNSTLVGTCRALGYSMAEFLTIWPSYCENWWLSSLWNNGSATFENITGIFDNVASGVTNYMRAVGLNYDFNDALPVTQADRAFVSGTAEETKLCIQFDWTWLLLPTVLTLVAVVLLVASILRTYLNGGSTPAWKSSLLPLLFHGFRDGVAGVPPDHRKGREELETSAKGMVVSYVPDEHGGCGIMLAEGMEMKKRRGGGYEHVGS